MFGLFKRHKKKEFSELEFYKPLFEGNYNFYFKIYFPVKIYKSLPVEPKLKTSNEFEDYVVNNLIDFEFKEQFEKECQSQKGEIFSFIGKDSSGNEINYTKRGVLVAKWLELQPAQLISYREFINSAHKPEDLNVNVQNLDSTPLPILEKILSLLLENFGNNKVVHKSFSGEITQWKLSQIKESIIELNLLNHLDRFYDSSFNWELLQPEDSHFLVVGTNTKKISSIFENNGLDVEEIFA